MIVVTRHRDLINLMLEMGIVKSDWPIFEHIDNLDFVRGKDLIGVVPAKLGILANSVTELPLNIPVEHHGTDIPLDLLRNMVAGEPQTYKLVIMPTRTKFDTAVICNHSTTFLQYVVRNGFIPRRGEQHMDAVKRNGLANKDLILNKPVLGNIRHNMGQFAEDITTFDLQYAFERRGLVHSITEMEECNKGLFTYKVMRIK